MIKKYDLKKRLKLYIKPYLSKANITQINGIKTLRNNYTRVT